MSRVTSVSTSAREVIPDCCAKLRHPPLVRLRDDKPAREVTRESGPGS
jgi:hypothetical protein